MSESQYLSAADIANQIEQPMTFDSKLNRVGFRASSAIGLCMSLEHQCRRAVVMKRAKTSFMNNMEGVMAGIGTQMVIAVSNFFESIADYNETTAKDKVMMGQIWDAIPPTLTHRPSTLALVHR